MMYFRKGRGLNIGIGNLENRTTIYELESRNKVANIREIPSMVKSINTIAIMKIDTTGFNVNKDEIFQAAVSRYFYDTDNNKIVGLRDHHSYTIDIEGDVPEKIAFKTGINKTNLEVEGLVDEEIEEAIGELVELLNECSYIVCHHARFVKGFLDNLELFEDLTTPFLCSLTQIDWVYKEDYHTSNLQGILLQNNVFFDIKDTAQYLDAIAFLLDQRPRTIEGETYLECLLKDIQVEYYHVKALYAPFRVKDKLKDNGYFWNPSDKVWHKTVIIDDMEDEETWLALNIYEKNDCCHSKDEIRPSERFNK